MSFVTSVLIRVPADCQGKLKDYLSTFAWDGRTANVGVLSTNGAGGQKAISDCIYAAGFNCLPAEEFIDHLAAFDWPYPEETVVLIRPESGSLVVWTPAQPEPTPHHFRGPHPMRFVLGTTEAELRTLESAPDIGEPEHG